MAKHRRIHQDKGEEVEEDSRLKSRAQQPLYDQLKAPGEGVIAINDFLAEPPIGGQAAALTGIHSDEHRANMVTQLQQTHGNKYVQRMAETGKEPAVKRNIMQEIDSQRTSGKPLEPGARSEAEAFHRRDLSQVRVHNDKKAGELCHELGARAFTQGNDIFARPEESIDTTQGGKELLNHELTHVVQQQEGRAMALKGVGGNSSDRSILESEAEQDSRNPGSRVSDMPEAVATPAGASKAIQLTPVSLETLESDLRTEGDRMLDDYSTAQRDTVQSWFTDLRGKVNGTIDEFTMLETAEGGATLGLGGTTLGAHATMVGAATAATALTIVVPILVALVGVSAWYVGSDAKTDIGNALDARLAAWRANIETYRNEWRPTMRTLAGEFARTVSEEDRDSDNYESIFQRFREYCEAPPVEAVSNSLWNRLTTCWNQYVQNSRFNAWYPREAGQLLMTARSGVTTESMRIESLELVLPEPIEPIPPSEANLPRISSGD